MKKKTFVFVTILAICLTLSVGFGRVKTNSMEPEVMTGSFVFYTRLFSKDALKEGDIVLYRDSTGRLICHRIINIEDDLIITKGDSLSELDPVINKSDVVGKYLFNVF